MTDWADEIETTIANEYGSHGAILAADADGMIAKALRKAKADGMREANVALSTAALDGNFDGLNLVRELVLRADKIEKGQ